MVAKKRARNNGADMIRAARRLAALALCAGACCAATAQVADRTPPVREKAEVMIANRPIITLYGPIGGHSASDRVEQTTTRIYRVIDEEARPVVSMQPGTDGTDVLIGGKRVYTVTRIDIDPQFGETTDNVARESVARLTQAIGEYDEQHTVRFLAIAALWTVLATAIYLLVLRTTFVVDRRIAARLVAFAAARTENVKLRGASVLDANTAAVLTRRIVRFVAWGIALVATYAWLTISLTRFPYTRPWGERMASALLAQLAGMAGAVADAMPGVFVVVVIFVIARAVVRLAALFFRRVEAGKAEVAGLDAQTVAPTRWLFNVAVYLFALAIAFPYFPGASSDAFKGLSVLVGLMISIGGSGLAGQGLAGLILIYSRAIRVGDCVRVGDFEGVVSRVAAFTTRLRTPSGDEVMLSNSQILQTATRNFSCTRHAVRYAVDTAVTIGYATPWRQVVALLELAARRTPGIASSPAPFVRQTALSDFYVEYRLVAYASPETATDRDDTLDRLHESILDVFNEYGVQITSPNYEADPPDPQIVPRERWYAAPATPADSPDAKVAGGPP
ncbi:MAG: mechanosensitive ion channel [Burkholderiales bacterium]|nr:mechanosensitive ion channel [Burkholderiales bacterium]